MNLIIGVIIVVSDVISGFVLSNAEIIALRQPIELLIIGGASVGTFVIASPSSAIKGTFQQLPLLLTGQKFITTYYIEMLSFFYHLFNPTCPQIAVFGRDNPHAPINTRILIIVLKNSIANHIQNEVLECGRNDS